MADETQAQRKDASEEASSPFPRDAADRAPAAEYDAADCDAAGSKRELLSRCEIQGGLVVHLGCRDEKLMAEFARDARPLSLL